MGSYFFWPSKGEEMFRSVAEMNIFDEYIGYEKVLIFDEHCKGWTDSPEKNLFYLRGLQNYYNNRLKKDGYVLLSDIYEDFEYHDDYIYGWGWSYDENKPWGENYIDFGIYDIRQMKNRNFVNGKNPNVILKFNADCDLSNLVIDKYIANNGEWCDYAMPLHIGGGMHC